MQIKDMSTPKLIEAVKASYNAVYVYECFSTRDLMFYEMGAGELSDRGYMVEEKTELIINLL